MLEIQHVIRLAFRSWRRSWGFATIAVITLALGIGSATAIFSVINAVLLRPFGYSRTSELVQISGTNAQGQPLGVSAPDFQAIQQRAHTLRSVAASRVQAFTILGTREPVNVYGQAVTPDCFALLEAQPLMGRMFAEADYRGDAPAVAVLSYRLWQREFAADRQIVGRRLLIDGTTYEVIGVMRSEFQFPQAAFQIWTPWRVSAAEMANHRAHPYRVVARLRRGVTMQAAAAELTQISAALAKEFPDTNTGWRATVDPIDEQIVGRLRPTLWTMLGAVGCVLLIACLNVANLLMARGLARTKELAIRAALGAGKARLVTQLLTESLLLALIGGALGTLLAQGLLKLLLSMPSRSVGVFPRLDQASLDPIVLAVALALTIGSGVLFGLMPALSLSRPDLESVLRDGGRANTTGTGHRRFLSALIVAESALSVVLLVGAALMMRSFLKMVEVQPGFRAEHVLSAEIPSQWRPNFGNTAAMTAQKSHFFDDVLSRLAAIPGVNATGLITGLPMGTVATQTLIRLESVTPQPGTDLRVGYSSVSPGYFATMGISLLRGRTFSGEDTADRPLAAIVNEAMARRMWPGEDALGKRFTFNPNGTGPWTTVVGVAANVRHSGLRTDPDSYLYMSYRQSLLAPQNAAVILRTSLDPASLAQAVRTAIHQVDPNQPVTSVRTLTQVVADSVAEPRMYTVLLASFGALALVLAGAGVFAVLSWSVAQRTQEIGIRMALGARNADVVGAVMRRAVGETVAGIVVGLAGAAALTGFLKSQLFEVTALDPVAFVVGPAILLATAVVAAYVPARRATRVDPVTALSAH